MFGLNFLHRLLGDVHTPHYFNEIALVGVEADKPSGAAAKDNMLYYETDTGLYKRYRTALSSWVIVSSIAQIMGYDYTNALFKNFAVDPTTKALLLKSEIAWEGEIDHGSLLGLSDDDHNHYYNQTRGDNRYLKKVNDIHGICFILRGVATTGTKKTQALIPCPLTISTVIIYSDVAPTGSSLIVDVNKNSTTIFTTQANRPEIASSGHSDESGTPNITSLAKGNRVSIDVDQIGSGTAGGDDLMATLIC